MRTIHKHDLAVGGNQVPTFRGAQVLHVAEQRGQLRVWLEVDDAAPRTSKRFLVVGTGQPISDRFRGYAHAGTALCDGGSFVWHVLEERIDQAGQPL